MLEETSSLQAATEADLARGEWRTAALDYPFGRGLSFEITVADVEPLLTRLQAHQIPLKLGLHEKWYRVDDRERGLRQFLVLDPDGYLLRFAQVLGDRHRHRQ